jgi:hypothetical protein
MTMLELLARVRSLTDLRGVPNATAATGYKLDPGHFTGWAKASAW